MQGLLSLYSELLRRRPILTKSVTSGAISCAGSCLTQLATQPAGPSSNLSFDTSSHPHLPWPGLSPRVAGAFLVYGGLVTGPVTHYFYLLLDKYSTPNHFFFIKITFENYPNAHGQ